MNFKYYKSLLQLVFLLVTGFFIYIVLHNNWSTILFQLNELTFSKQLLALFFIFIQIYMSFYAWFLIQQSITAKKTSQKLFFSVFFSSNLAKYIPGGIWDHVGKYTLLSKHSDYTKTEITQGIYIYLLYTVITGSIFFIPLIALTWGLKYLLLLALFLFLMFLVINFSKGKIKSLSSKYSLLSFIFSAVQWKYLKPILILLLSWIFYGLSLYFLVDKDITDPRQSLSVILVAPIAWLTGFIFPLAPNGIGIRESVIYYFLSDGIAHSTVIAALLVFRVFAIIVDLLLGAVSLFLLKRKI